MTSPQEQIIREYLTEELGVEVRECDRSILGNGQELDVVVGSHMLAIEVDGVYWHSSQFKDKHYHQNKQELAADKGYELIQIFDTEINGKLPIVKSMIRHKLGMTSRRVHARAAEVVEISPKEYREFLTTSHLQGPINSYHKLGLQVDGELVSVLGASYRGRRWVIDRFCSRVDTNVVGGFQRLLTHLRRRVSGPLYTHSANRYTSGRVYEKSGFRRVNHAPYTLFYVEKGGAGISSREKYQKHKLYDLFPDYDGSNVEEFLVGKGIYTLYAAGTTTWRLD